MKANGLVIICDSFLTDPISLGGIRRDYSFHRQHLLLQTVASGLHSQLDSRQVGSSLCARAWNIYRNMDCCWHFFSRLSVPRSADLGLPTR